VGRWSWVVGRVLWVVVIVIVVVGRGSWVVGRGPCVVVVVDVVVVVWSWVVGRRTWVVSRGSGSWVVGRGRRSSMVDEVVGRRSLVVGRAVGRGSWDVGCRRAESAGSSALAMLRALLRVRPGLVQSSEALPPEGAAYDVMKASCNARQKNQRGAPPPHSHKGKHHTKGGKQHRGNPPANTPPTADPLEEGRGATIGGAVKQPSDFRVKEHPRLVAPKKNHPPLVAPKKNHPPLVAPKKNHPPLRAYMANGRPRSLKPAHVPAPHSASMVASSVAHATSRATAPHRASNFVSLAALTLKPSE